MVITVIIMVIIMVTIMPVIMICLLSDNHRPFLHICAKDI